MVSIDHNKTCEKISRATNFVSNNVSKEKVIAQIVIVACFASNKTKIAKKKNNIRLNNTSPPFNVYSSLSKFMED